LWWYFDLVDAHGQGMVLIWSYGLPFLPGIASAARRDRPLLPSTRPAINIVFYQHGAPVFYLLQEYPPEQTEWDGLRWRIGDNHMTATLHTHQDDDIKRLVTDLPFRCPVPGSTQPLIGQLRVEGALRQTGSDQTADPKP